MTPNGHAAHGYWTTDECVVCHRIDAMDSPFVRLTPWCKDRIGLEDYRLIESRARAMNVVLGAIFSTRHGYVCTAERGERRVELRAHGPLAAVLAGVLDDLEAA